MPHPNESSILPKFLEKSDPEVARPALSTWPVQKSQPKAFEICASIQIHQSPYRDRWQFKTTPGPAQEVCLVAIRCISLVTAVHLKRLTQCKDLLVGHLNKRYTKTRLYTPIFNEGCFGIWPLKCRIQNAMQCFAWVTTKQWISKTKARFPKQPLLK